jgi:O-antigen/teichoic acid export membrane protein
MKFNLHIKQKVQQFQAPLYKNAVYLIINSVLTGVVGLVFWILAARFYRAEDVGLASATISAMMLLALLSTLGLDYGLIRFLPDSGKDANAMVNSCLTINGLVSIIVAFIFIAGLGFWSPALLFLRHDPIYLSAFVIFTMSYTLFTLFSRVFIANRRAGFTLAQGVIFNLLRLPLVFILATFFATFGIFASWGIAAAVSVGIGIIWFLTRVQAGYRPIPSIRIKVVNQMVRFSFANYIAALLWFAPSLILPMVVVNLVSAEANAYFYIAWAVTNVLSTIPVGTSLSLFAEGSHQEERLARDTIKSLKFTFSLVIPALLIIFLVGDKIMLIFGRDYSENATTLLQILILSLIPLSLNAIYFGIKRVQMKMKGVIALSAFIAVATLVLSWILLPRIGIQGAGWAWLASQGVVTLGIISSFILRRPSVRKMAP